MKNEKLLSILILITLLNQILTFRVNLKTVNSNSYPSLRSLSPMSTLHGDSVDLCYYYAYLYLGEPPVKQSYIVDTGSTVTAAPCRPFCTHCGKHENSYFTVKSKDQILGCQNSYCSLITSSCRNEQCSFSVSYSEGSSIKGIYINETLRFGDNYAKDKSNYLPIGCTTNENNLFYTQLADGIMGLGNSDRNFVSLLYKRKVIKHNVFSLCLAQEGGYFEIGEINQKFHKEKITYINLSPSSSFYNIKIFSLEVNGAVLDLKNKNNDKDVKYNAIIDSGTTISYFPKDINNFILNEFTKICKKNENKDKCGTFEENKDYGPCYVFDDFESMKYAVSKFWPDITFNINKVYKYVWTPFDYLYSYKEENKKQYACLGFTSESGRITLGSTWMHGHDIIFDKENSRIGIARAECEYPPPTPSSTDSGSKIDETQAIEAVAISQRIWEMKIKEKKMIALFVAFASLLVILLIICIIVIIRLVQGKTCFCLGQKLKGYQVPSKSEVGAIDIESSISNKIEAPTKLDEINVESLDEKEENNKDVKNV